MKPAANACYLALLLLLTAGASLGCGTGAKQQAQADNYYQLAQTYLGAESYDAAERAIRQALSLRPRESRYFELLALTHQVRGRFDLAEDAYQQALQQSDPPPSVLVNYSTLLLLRHQPDEALELAQRALQDPGYDRPAFAHVNMGLAYSQQGQFAAAAAQFRRALTYVSLPEAYHNLGLAYDGMGQHEAAIQAFRDAIRLRPTYAAAYAGLGEALLAAGQVGEARQALERVIALQPGSPLAVASREQLDRLVP
jgi:Tfp pilus assembly protein PilF